MNLVRNFIKTFVKSNWALTGFLLCWCFSAEAQKIGLGSNAKPAAAASNMGIDPANPKEYTIAEVTVSGTQFLGPQFHGLYLRTKARG
jgi:outer membrane protein insertion porin family